MPDGIIPHNRFLTQDGGDALISFRGSQVILFTPQQEHRAVHLFRRLQQVRAMPREKQPGADFIAEAETAGRQIRASSRRESADSVMAMQERGLQVHSMTEAVEAAWAEMAESSLLPEIRGTIVPEDTYDEVQRLVRRYRSRQGNAEP